MSTPPEPSSTAGARGSFGPNAWLVDDLYDQYLADPQSVSSSWREFFSDYQHSAIPPAVTPSEPVVQAARVPEVDATPLRGAAARIVLNMEASLAVPTATSVRTVSARLLEINRSALNESLARSTGAKVSFTHLIAYAVVKGLSAVPALNSSFVDTVDERGTHGVRRHEHVGLGLAVDVERPDGSRNLLVPVIPRADTLNFRDFLLAYEELVRKVHGGTFGADDFVGATVSLTNPGTLGTVQSVPRLMPGQGTIIGVGSLAWPPGFEAADPRALAELGVGKVMNLTSTYDHRIIQGAESGLFLKFVAECLTGQHDFYDDVFASLGVPYRPTTWSRDSYASPSGDERSLKEVRVQELINAFRVRGHLNAHLDPLSSRPPDAHPELSMETYGLTMWDLPRSFVVDGLAGRRTATLDEILSILRDAYCRTIGIEYGHILDPAQKRWIQSRVEGIPFSTNLEEQRRILAALIEAEVFERFLHSRYVGQKRFGLEGAESTIVIMTTILDAAAESGVKEAVIGMAHRGRLNVLANIVGKSYSDIFSEFEGNLDPESVQGSGDVKYHKGARGVFKSYVGATVEVSMASNPSHLEAVSPVVEGIVRAKQDRVLVPSDGTQPRDVADLYPFLPLLVHGDAAFAGQGVVAETLNLSQLSGYHVGGAIHLVINNQVGFTTAPDSARSSFYPTDVAKMIQAPIFHVNGDDPEACAHAARLAYDYREAFHRDVVIDLVCYRRHGHNEGDDPSYTQPAMYKVIDQLRSVRKIYTETLIRRGDISLEEAEGSLEEFNSRLERILEEVRAVPVPKLDKVPAPPFPSDPVAPDTSVERDVLDDVARAVTSAPENFTIHPKLQRQFAQRTALFESGQVDWALGEALAIGSLVKEGVNVRLTGQDTRRGTFSQRNSALIDYETSDEWVPLSNLGGPGFFTVRDSLLSEYAALGFEYGYSVESPQALVCWEAQFGDFVNGAEIIIDNFLVAAEDKWGQRANVVLLLPHGFEGQGPEHSSARLERFLSLSARNNIRIAQPTSAAQYFHLLRSQVRRERPSPLIVLTPKSMLRAVQSRSRIDELVRGSFQTVIDDTVDTSSVRRVVLASGKIVHEAREHREQIESPDVAIVSVEQIYPWPAERLDEVVARYGELDEIIWLQEEPENMGAWPFVHLRMHHQFRGVNVRRVARGESASPATGSALVHNAEQLDLLTRAIG